MFKAVVDHGGINQAAAVIHKSQSSIHSSVHKIEDILGIKLFNVEGRQLTLTKGDEMMIRRAEYLLEEAYKVEAVGQTLAKGIESNLYIAVDESYPKELLYKALDNTSLKYPLINIEIVETVLSGANELIEEGGVEVAISPYCVENMFSEELCQIKFTAYSAPQHVLQLKNRTLQLEDLMAHRQVVVRDSSQDNKVNEGWLSANQRWTVSHIKTSIDLVRKGLGFAWLPERMVKKDIDDGTLKVLNLVRGSSRVMPLYVLFKDYDGLGPGAKAFLSEMRLQTFEV